MSLPQCPPMMLEVEGRKAAASGHGKMPTSRTFRPERETLMKSAGLYWGPKAGLGQAGLGG